MNNSYDVYNKNIQVRMF